MNDSLDRRLAAARHEIRQVSDWLLRPSAETLAACVPALARAVAFVGEPHASMDPAGPNTHLRTAAEQLSEEIQGAQILLRAAAELYFGRMRRLATQDPNPAALPPPAERISVTG